MQDRKIQRIERRIEGFTVQSGLPRVLGHPIEDSYQIDRNRGIIAVADGVTRDVSEYSPDKSNFLERLYFLYKYQRPSHATNVANLFTETFVRTLRGYQSVDEESIKQGYSEANKAIRDYNERAGLGRDFLLNDLAGCVASTAVLYDDGVWLGHICDSGAAIIDRTGKVVSKTVNDGALEILKKLHDPEYLKRPDERDPSTRTWLRKNFRNNPNARFSHGVLNGNPNALEYVNVSFHPLGKGDTVLVYTDGIEERMFYRLGVLRPEFASAIKEKNLKMLKDLAIRQINFEGTLVHLLD